MSDKGISDQNFFAGQSDESPQQRQILQEKELHGSDSRLKTFFNASYINSLVKTRQESEPAFIAASSPIFSGNNME